MDVNSDLDNDRYLHIITAVSKVIPFEYFRTILFKNYSL